MSWLRFTRSRDMSRTIGISCFLVSITVVSISLSHASPQARAPCESGSRGRCTKVESESTLGHYRFASGAVGHMQFLGREDFAGFKTKRRAQLTQAAANEAGWDGTL